MSLTEANTGFGYVPVINPEIFILSLCCSTFYGFPDKRQMAPTSDSLIKG